MPSERFHNLKQVKKRTFLKMAYKEFSMHPYEGASITRLVSDLKMAKGSIYQYFEDKDDLYYFLVKHAYRQLYLVLSKACPIVKSSVDFDSWYKNYLLVYMKFLCAMPSHAYLMIRNEVESFSKSTTDELDIKKMIEQSSAVTLPKEKVYYLSTLPFLLFRFLIETEGIEVNKMLESGGSLDIQSDKLLYLCEAFLNNNKL